MKEETLDEGRWGLVREYKDETRMTEPLRVDYKSKRWILQVHHPSTCAAQILHVIIITKLLFQLLPDKWGIHGHDFYKRREK
jgi:hypothetical protein